MESKKDIGNYFKENLEQLDYSPSPKVWEGIEVELKKKKKRRFIFWMFFAVIAVLGLSTYTYVNHSNSGNTPTNGIVTTGTDNRNTNSNVSDTNNSGDFDPKSPDSNNANANNTNLNNKKEKEAKGQNELVDEGRTTTDENPINAKTNSGKNSNSKKAGIKNKPSKLKPTTSIGVVNNNKKTEKNLLGKSKKTNYKKGGKLKSEKSSFAGNKSGKHSKKTKKSGKSNAADGLTDTTKNNSLDALKMAESEAVPGSEKEETISGDLKNAATNPIAASDKNKKLSLEDLKKANQKKRDSLVAARKTEKEKKDLAQKPKEEEKDSTTTEVTKSGHEIIVAPYYGYNYNGNLGNGNFLNDSKTSKKGSQFQSSYGVLVRWMGSEKMGFQMGVGIINSTYSATFTKENNSFINPQNVSLEIPLSELNQLFPSDTIKTKVTSTHKSSFIEVPVEGYYIFKDKKFGFATAYGVSFLILQHNEFFLESETVSRFKAGELKNISPFSFSANIKLNLFYKISKKLQFDLYPSLQYQIMGFKDVSNYHSYFFSIKTGLSYKL